MSLHELIRLFRKTGAILKVKCIKKNHTVYPVYDSYPGHYDEAIQYTSDSGRVGW